MMIPRSACALTAALLAISVVTNGQESVKEPSTGKSFPAAVKYAHEGAEYSMSLTGVTVRTKYFIKAKVYGMAHYAQDPVRGKTEEVLKAMSVDGKAKQITMDFARDVDAEKIKEAYGEGFKENATAEELKTIQPLVDQFIGFFTKEVKENQQFVLRWLPGGVIIASVAGEQKPALTNPVFARVLWSIWFGKNSIVDRDELVSRVAD